MFVCCWDRGEVRGGREVVLVEGAWGIGGGVAGLGMRDCCFLADFQIYGLLRRDPSFFVACADVTANPLGAEDTVPEGEERLAEVCLDAPALVVHVVVAGVVAREALEGVEWQGVAAVVVDCLERAACEEAHPLPGTHPRDLEGQASA